MRPTLDEQLAGIDRLLELIASDSTLGDESALLLRDARRQLGRLHGSLPANLRFLRWDNAATVALLKTVAPILPADLQAAMAKPAEVGPDPGGDTRTSEEVETEKNDRLRELLTRAILALPETNDGEAARMRIIKHLLARVDANPALNKNPVIADGLPS